jgi:hypothetical protein
VSAVTLDWPVKTGRGRCGTGGAAAPENGGRKTCAIRTDT